MTTQKTLTTIALASACLLGMVAPAQASTTVVAPATSVRTTTEAPITGVETPQQAATRQYAHDVATDILIGNAGLGRPLPKAPAGANLKDPNLARIVAAHKAKAYNTLGGIRHGNDGVLYGTISYQGGLLVVNPSSGLVRHVNPLTGGTYVLPAKSAAFTWMPSGGIGAKWKSLGGAKSVGLPTGPEAKGVAGVHQGALAYVSQTFSLNGAQSDIMWTQRYGSHQIKGAIRAKYLANGGSRTQGAPVSDERVNADKSVTQHFERGSITWYPGGKIVRK